MTTPIPTKKFLKEFEPKEDKVFSCFGFMRGRKVAKQQEDLKVSRNPIFKEHEGKKSDER